MLSRRHFLATLPLPALAASNGAKYRAFIGTYTRGDSKGIYSFVLDTAAGTLTPEGLAAEIENPSFLAIHPSGNYLYAVGETSKFKDQESGSVTAFQIGGDGKLTRLNDAASGGPGPCHVNVTRNGKFLAVANYNGGSCAAFGIDPSGKIGQRTAFFQHKGSSVNPARQKEPHAHSVNFDRDNKHLIVADLGMDKVLAYKFNASTGAMQEGKAFSSKPGSGPRHFNFHPSGKFAYAINELNCTVTALKWNNGAFTEIETQTTLPVEWKQGYSTAEVLVHPSGKFLYGSNRGHNTLAVFQIDAASGKLKAVQHQSTMGEIPRNFAIEPGGEYLIAANQNSSTLVLFKIDQQTGALTAAGSPVAAPIPVCVRYKRISA